MQGLPFRAIIHVPGCLRKEQVFRCIQALRFHWPIGQAEYELDTNKRLPHHALRSCFHRPQQQLHALETVAQVCSQLPQLLLLTSKDTRSPPTPGTNVFEKLDALAGEHLHLRKEGLW